MSMKSILAAITGFAFVVLVLILMQPGETPEQVPLALPALQANLADTSVSGISSGAYMAGQFQLAHADIVKGAAIIAGGPFGCAESAFAGVVPGPGTVFLNASRAVNGCMLNSLSMWGIPNPGVLAQRAEKLSRDGLIGDMTDVTNDRVYLFAGSRDDVVRPAIVAAAAEFYRKLGVADVQLRHVTDVPAGHAFITEAKGGECHTSASPYIVDCDYDQAGSLLGHILGPLSTPATAASGDFRVFDQRPFTKGLRDHGMAQAGFVYIPKACAGADREVCRVHVAFHGCAQNRAAVGDTFARDTGFARWADTNRLIILFPQVTQAAINPKGCWDWWGYTGRDYLTRKAPQIQAVRAMLGQLSAERGGVS